MCNVLAWSLGGRMTCRCIVYTTLHRAAFEKACNLALCNLSVRCLIFLLQLIYSCLAVAFTVTNTEEGSNEVPRVVPSTSSSYETPPPSADQMASVKRPSSVTVKTESGPPKKVALSSFVVRTTPADKNAIDEQIARMVFATNSAFSLGEHPEFKKLVSMLRPGYIAPTRKEVSDKLLPVVFAKEKEKCKDTLKGEIVNVALDGWSNVSLLYA
jgi:hypothetical protein